MKQDFANQRACQLSLFNGIVSTLSPNSFLASAKDKRTASVHTDLSHEGRPASGSVGHGSAQCSQTRPPRRPVLIRGTLLD